MAKNIEIKARASHFERQVMCAQKLTQTPGEVIVQKDIFFHSQKGRLKLRFFAQGDAELIGYHRPDQEGPAASQYFRHAVPDPTPLEHLLKMTCGERGTVRKTRRLFLFGQTRIHMDKVEGLGEFIELEVVLDSVTSDAEGESIAKTLMAKLGIESEDLISTAYIDMLSPSPSSTEN